MSNGRRRHIVPVQMIRRFANADGRLFCLNKATLCIPDRAIGNDPRTILYKPNYYRDEFGDLDRNWIQPIEAAFADCYQSLIAASAEDRDLNPTEQAAVIQWIACLQCRTELFPESMDTLKASEHMRRRSRVDWSTAAIANRQRRGFAQDYERLYTSTGWYWKMATLREGRSLILTDHPVCHTPEQEPHGMVVFVPLSKTQILIGGGRTALQQIRAMGVEQVNLFLAAWANRLIYAESVPTLERVAIQLRAAGEPATLPFFGLIQRMETSRPPPGFARGGVFDNIRRRVVEREQQFGDHEP